MLEIRRILVPIDFSERCRRALEAAIEVANRFDAIALKALHVWQYPAYGSQGLLISQAGYPEQTLIEWTRQEAARELERFMDPFVGRGIPIERQLESGSPAHVIIEVAERDHSDLIVMGSHGRSGLSRLLLGSVAERTIRGAHCPILVIRASKEEEAKIA